MFYYYRNKDSEIIDWLSTFMVSSLTDILIIENLKNFLITASIIYIGPYLIKKFNKDESH